MASEAVYSNVRNNLIERRIEGGGNLKNKSYRVNVKRYNTEINWYSLFGKTQKPRTGNQCSFNQTRCLEDMLRCCCYFLKWPRAGLYSLNEGPAPSFRWIFQLPDQRPSFVYISTPSKATTSSKILLVVIFEWAPQLRKSFETSLMSFL